MTKEKILWSVGQVSERTGVAVSTLHYYEKEGLISSRRNAGNQRRYEPNVLRRISVIKTAQTLGVSLREIKNVFQALPNNRTPTTSDWKKLSSNWRKSLQQRIEQLERLRDQLDDCIGCGCLSIKKCNLRNPEDIVAKDGPGPVLLKQGKR
ncbi:redox-sensitive transcriptional activator SoxR [Pleionea sediminis]|uniref:redox-sensitive transcriptional activator SoxR n=1 Tax=Pleionea sediminis TaxID=2569479 RepID=UPI0013DDC378|nr:redox-sensitive transcriptional activator SoxR [Pleionea sediminis]